MPRDWKSVLKKGVEMAKEAKSELEERGLIGGEPPPPPAAPPADPVAAAAEVSQVIGPDHPHPFDLLTTAEVASALGVGPDAVHGPTANVVDECAGPSWRVQVEGGEVSVDLLLYLHPVDPEELLGYSDEGARRLPGLGDRAAIADEGVAVVRGGEVVTVHVSGGHGFDRRAALVAMAGAVASRLPDFRQYAARMSAPGGPVLADVFPTERLSTLLGVPLETPELERGADEYSAVWREPEPDPAPDDPDDPDDPQGERLRVEVTVYLVDPEEQQRRAAAAGGIFAQAAVQFGEAMKEQLAEHFRPVPGPWDEGYLWPTQAYFKKGGRSYRIEVHGARRDLSAQVRLLAERLAATAV